MAVHSSLSNKRLPENGGFSSEGFPSKFKRRRKPCAVRDFPRNCGPSKPNTGIHSPVKCSSMVESCPSNFSEKSDPLASGTNGGRTEGFNKMEKPKIVDDIAEEMGSENEQKLGPLEAVLESAIEKVAEFIALQRGLVASILSEGVDGQKLEENFGADVSLKRVQEKEDNTGVEMKWGDLGDDIYVLSPQDVKLKRFRVKFDGQGGDDLVGSQGTEIIVLEDDDSVSEKDGKICGENRQEPEFLDSDQYEVEKEREDESMDNFTTDENLACVEFKDTSNDEPKNYQTPEELGDLCIAKHDGPERYKVREALIKFEEHYEALKKEWRERKAEMGEGQKGQAYARLAAKRVEAEGMCISVQNPFGHIPGIEIGDTFRFRAQLVVVGLHNHMINGIDYVTIRHEMFATCVVDSGRYENETKTNDSLIYSGQGGNPKIVDKAADQKLIKGNLAMVNSMEMGYPVRVLRKRSGMASYGFGHSNDSEYLYVYDGLYAVTKYWQERDQNGRLVFKFELIRMPDQQRPRLAKPGKLLPHKEICVVHDISQGLEAHKIRAMNGIDDLRPPPFTYINKIIYPNWYRRVEPKGCNCINGCSDSHQCPCVVRNGGEIAFNEKGSIVRSRTIVYECGPNCKCPPSCMNRVSQHRPRIQLEIFKSKERGWGVRTRDDVTSGSFICEYIGELLRDEDAEQRIGHDEYLFDIFDGHNEDGEFKGLVGSRNRDAFAIDACKFGNVGRFVNHSCSPNMYAQEVLYDQDDEEMPHIMFFATRNIPALHELTYNYNYKIDRVCDANGNIKKKHCFCSSRNCKGRMY